MKIYDHCFFDYSRTVMKLEIPILDRVELEKWVCRFWTVWNSESRSGFWTRGVEGRLEDAIEMNIKHF